MLLKFFHNSKQFRKARLKMSRLIKHKGTQEWLAILALRISFTIISQAAMSNYGGFPCAPPVDQATGCPNVEMLSETSEDISETPEDNLES